jgi:hypothetical protein
MKRAIAKCALLLIVVAVWPAPVFARSYLHCLTKKVVIVDAPSRSTSSNTEENLTFWIDDAAKTIAFANGEPLTVKRFDDRWISATGGGVYYEFDRGRKNLTYAGTTMKDGTVTIVIGSGRCDIATDPAG